MVVDRDHVKPVGLGSRFREELGVAFYHDFSQMPQDAQTGLALFRAA
jgi:hypothetical protein